MINKYIFGILGILLITAFLVSGCTEEGTTIENQIEKAIGKTNNLGNPKLMGVVYENDSSMGVGIRADDNILEGILDDFKEVAPICFKNETITHCFTLNYFPVIDQYGNEKEEVIATLMINRETNNKINWENMDFTSTLNLLKKEGHIKIHPSLPQTLSSTPVNTSELQEQQSEPTPQTTTQTTTPTQTSSPAVEEESDTATMGEKNALSKALSYLRYTAFSYIGLIEQLEFEGYSHKEAEYGANNCGADWNEQAALKAQSYLNYSAFSREGLIEQLEYEGFTREQAEYGVQAVGY